MEVACAALAGISARLLCHPLDTIKTVSFTDLAGEAQAGQPSSSSRFVASAKEIWRGEGVRGFFRGVGVATLGSAPGVALYLGSYHMLRDELQALANDSAEYRAGRDEAWRLSVPTFHRLLVPVCQWMPASVIHFAAGLGAEAFSCLVWVPIDVSKERLQSQPPSLQNRYRGSYDALRTIIAKEGLAGLYRGYWSTLLSFGPFSAVYFVFYEYFTQALETALARQENKGFTEGSKEQLGTDAASTPRSARSFLVPLCAGAGGNIVASLCTNPLELVKTRMQVQRAVLNETHGARGTGTGRAVLYRHEYKGMLDGLRSIVKEEGWRSLWRGVGPRIAYTAPNAALTMMFFQYFVDRLSPSPKAA